jgi:hypothetical protein
VGDVGWGPLVTYLVHQTSDNQAISLEMSGYSHIPPEVAGEIRGLVGEFVYCSYAQGSSEDEGGGEDFEESESESRDAEDEW